MYDVAIVGMGPVGCTVAIVLANAGLTVAAIERDPEVYQLPRAVNLDAEIIRELQPCGLAEQVAALMQPLRSGECVGFANSRREYLFGNELRDFGSNGWQPANMFDQPEFEAFLRQQALLGPSVDNYIGFTASHFDDCGDHVSIEIQRASRQEKLQTRFLVACDGASSTTRKKMNIGWHDLGYNHDWLVVDVTTLPGHTLGDTTLQVCDPDRLSTYVATKDPYRRWEFKLNPGETWDEMLQTEKIHSLIQQWTPRGTYEIRRAAMYQFHAAVAEQWRKGRVFLAGDAAHQTPPFLGQGMNAGMRDAFNLGWKLPLVINGTASIELLDTFEQERGAHAHDLVEWAVSIGRLMEHLAAVEAAHGQGETPPPTPKQLKSSGYGQGREAPPLRAGVVVSEQVSDTGITGYLLRQPIVQTAGRVCHFDDLLDSDQAPGFAIVAHTADQLRVGAQAQKIVEQLNIKLLTLDSLSLVRGQFDRAFDSVSALIVRPDRYIFGHTDAQHNLNDLLLQLGEKLHLN